jgi:hypothetical protein
MRTKYFLFAALAVGALASCSSDELVGENTSPTTLTQENQAISFAGDRTMMTRATTGDITKLNGQFKLYGVKSGTTAGLDIQNVFINYSLWNQQSTDPDNTTNVYGWDYVGNAGADNLGMGNISLTSTQSIKYWDYTAADYRFVAGSPINAFVFSINSTTNAIESATVSGIGGHITPNPDGDPIGGAVYVATPKVVQKANYGQPVVMSFTGQQALVRVGVYETIPGYSISEIKFYGYDWATNKWETTPRQNIVLNSLSEENYFIGGTDKTSTVTYNWSDITNPTYTFSDPTGGTDKSSNQWFGGLFASGVPCTYSRSTVVADLFGTDKDMEASGYFPVLPMATGATSAIVIKCDYKLVSTDGSGEFINVKGATAAIPAVFSRWETNHAYTYLFKISDKTGGKTNVDPSATDPEGLYPIVFDAVVVNGQDNRDGFITTVNSPSITSYQYSSPYTNVNTSGHVTEAGIKYIAGAPIYVTVQDHETGALKTLSALNRTAPAVGMIQVYKLAGQAAESDLQINRPAEDKVFATTIPSVGWTLHGVNVSASDYITFTPDVDGWYAVEYVNYVDNSDPSNVKVSYAYKIVRVGEAPMN